MEKPRCLNGLSVEHMPYAPDVALVFEIRCGSCGAKGFALEEIHTGGSPTGLILVCELCGHSATVFDGLKHGYDGELGLTDHIKGETTRERLVGEDGSPVRHEGILLHFMYNVDKSERDEISKETGVSPIDLFDWFSVIQDNSSGETLWDYECA